MREDLTAIMVVIDGSGSMSNLRNSVVSGVNEFIADQRKAPGTVVLSMVQFNSVWSNFGLDGTTFSYKQIYHMKNLNEIADLTKEGYLPNGGTPLLEAQNKAIDEFGKDLAAIPEAERPSKVVFITVTDGQENQSDRTKVSKEGVATKVMHQRDAFNWQFIYLGANQDSFAEAGGLGIMHHATMNYVATDKGFRSALATASAATMSYREGATNTVDLQSLLKNKKDGEETL